MSLTDERIKEIYTDLDSAISSAEANEVEHDIRIGIVDSVYWVNAWQYLMRVNDELKQINCNVREDSKDHFIDDLRITLFNIRSYCRRNSVDLGLNSSGTSSGTPLFNFVSEKDFDIDYLDDYDI